MGKFIFKFFELIKNIIHFFKMLIIFCILMLILYWIQNLTGSAWGWINFIAPLLDFFIDAGDFIYSGSISLFSAVFEFKYGIALILMLILYQIFNLGLLITKFFENLYETGKKKLEKIEINNLNKTLANNEKKEQKKIKIYQFYVATLPKNTSRNNKINMDEQNKIMLKYLIDKTNVTPEKYKDGYLFTFLNFSEIDNTLDVFKKLIESKAPLDFIICVQIVGGDLKRERKQLDLLIGIQTINKITTFADTAYRYSFNEICKYKLTQMGVFQKENDTYEMHEFILDE